MLIGLDHFVLTTSDLDRCLRFYAGVLGMTLERYGEGRIALRFGAQKINVHPPEFVPGIKATTPTPGSLDLCFLSDMPMQDIIGRLEAHQIPIEQGPVRRAGAQFGLESVYVRDPDGNLVEISVRA
jgi:catechol 2,3-dioxygenase-like lactoylglutathione lyase family enzyme